MGKGNRSRIERAMNESANAEKHVQVKKNKVSGAGIFVAIAAILVVVALLVGAIGVVNDSGWFARSQTVIKTENFKVDGSMMNYFYTTQFNNYYQTYYNYVSSMFGSSSNIDLSSYVYQYMGITDASKSLKDQYMPVSEGAEKTDPVTVFDYYMSLTEDYVARMLTYCEFAVKAGLELTEEDYADIDKTLENMENTYKTYKSLYDSIGYAYPATFSAYLAQNYGSGVNEKDIRNCMELVTLAAKFEEKLTEEKKQAIIDDKTNKAVEDFVKENPSLFLMADYYSYSFSVNNKGKTDAEFEAEKAEILEQAKKLAGVTDKDAYKAAVLALLEEAELESYRDKNWDTFLKENENDESKTEEAIKKSFYEKVWTDATKDVKFEATLSTGSKHPSTHTDLSKWIFGYDAGEHTEDCTHEGEHDKSNEPAKKGDLTYIESTSEKEETVTKETTAATTEEPTTDAADPASEETTAEETTAEETTAGETTTAATTTTTTEKIKVTTYTVTVYLLEKETYRNEEITKHFGYVMFEKKADAEKFYEEYKKGEMNKDTLLETVEKLSGEITPFAYDAAEDYLPGDLQDQKVDGADKWLETAKPGDHSEVIELTYTTTKTENNTTKEEKKTYYSILVYDKDGYTAWYNDALAGATDNAVVDWYDENALDLTFNEKAYRFINA